MRMGTTVQRIICGVATLASAAAVGCGPGLMAPLPSATGVSGLGFTKSNLEMIVEPEAGVGPLVKAITGAKQSVHMKMYMMTEPNIINALANAAKKLKAKDGQPAVQVLMEHWYYDNTDPDNMVKVFNPRNEEAAKQLQAAGVEVKWAKNREEQGSGEWFNLTHEKSIVIDSGQPNQVAWIMTANMTNSAFTKNREYLIINKNKAEVDYTEACFQADWSGTPFRTLSPNLVVSPSMGRFANNARAQVIRILESAKKSVTVQMEVFNDPDVMETLGMMVKRGVDVRLTMAHFEPKKPGEAQPDDVMAQELARYGVTKVKFARNIGMHAKAIVADGARAYVGSINLTKGSMDRNRELGILTDNTPIVNTLVATEAKDWNAATAAPGGGAPAQKGRAPVKAKHWVLNENAGT
jgi:cardiolipin synthase